MAPSKSRWNTYSQGRPSRGRDSIFSRLMLRRAKTAMQRNSAPGTCGVAKSTEVLSGRPIGRPSRDSRKKRVKLARWSSRPLASTRAPYSRADSSGAIAAVSRAGCSRSSRTLPAVSWVATRVSRGCRRKKSSHCASATGCEKTRRTSRRRTPGRATRQCDTRMIASPATFSGESRSRSYTR
ncbi:MAG: hypothetical protein AUH92_00410 [Acidobacteria bacterium 13_1_40CM_4_69_4]|nr:MAG: hypothetical protein AUH92_00410 [Acidobacteria bacterium 13_1_40CM_4_69_4]